MRRFTDNFDPFSILWAIITAVQFVVCFVPTSGGGRRAVEGFQDVEEPKVFGWLRIGTLRLCFRVRVLLGDP